MTFDRWSYTNSGLKTARSCMRKFELRYVQMLERDDDERSEALAVGSCWHLAHEELARTGEVDAYAAIRNHAPNELWSVKLARLLSGYLWYWQDQPLNVIEPEYTFEHEDEATGIVMSGQVDGIVEFAGRRGIIERKTTSLSLDSESDYWPMLRLDTQVGIYALAVTPRPEFILYDVVRKPTINPKKIAKKEREAMRAAGEQGLLVSYFGESFPWDGIGEHVMTEERETPAMYGARLTADIVERPDFYFARREIHRTEDDFAALRGDIVDQVELIEAAEPERNYPRNPDACLNFGRCDFYSLCANNARPERGTIPDGFRQREHLHPELVDDSVATNQ